MAADTRASRPQAHGPAVRDGARLMMLLARFGAIFSDAFAERVHERDLVGNVPLMVLFDLDANGPRRPADIQSLTGLTSGGVTKLLDRLESRGVVRRLAGHPLGDRRGVVVDLTADGIRLVGDLATCLEARLDDLRVFAADLNALLDASPGAPREAPGVPASVHRPPGSPAAELAELAEPSPSSVPPSRSPHRADAD